jgi:MFS family permease
VLMSVEHAPDGRRGLYGSFVALGLPTGLILANLVFLIASVAVSRDQFLAWGWRIPFLASAVLVVVGLFVRMRVTETPVFADVKHKRAEHRLPVLDLLRDHRRTVLLAAGSCLSGSALGYIGTVYFVTYATRELGVPLSRTLAVLVLSAVVLAASMLVFAVWSDRWGRRRILTWGLAAQVLWSLIFFPLIDTQSVSLIALAVCGMMFFQGPYMGSQPATFAELFPATVRYSGVSLSQTIGVIVGGALAPIIASTLFGVARRSWPITVYLVTLSLLSWLCGLGLKETYRVTLFTETNGSHERDLRSLGDEP